MTIHNLSNLTLSPDELRVLNKGLSFALSPTTSPIKTHRQLLRDFDNYAKTVRQKYVHATYHRPLNSEQMSTEETTVTSHIHRRMKFLPKQEFNTLSQRYSGIGKVEQYIEVTKNSLNNLLPFITATNKSNVTQSERNAIKVMKQNKNTVTIKPADKNLGIVLMNTDDYISHCLELLKDTRTYRQAPTYPEEVIRKQIMNVITSYKSQLQNYNKRLYTMLLPQAKSQIPQLYGIPKVHKKFANFPPIRPIVSQTNALLGPSARFLDHVLQPLAQSYPDYLHNSTALSLQLQELTVNDDTLLVTIDVENLYPSIPQSDLLQVIYDEMCEHRHLLLFDPNLIIRLLHLNVNHNYFNFSDVTFQQVKGTAMGAAFSPSVANIYMSVNVRRFLRTQRKKPQLLVRYIDDVFMLWPHTSDELETFLTDLNNFNPALHYTYEYSPSTANFLDLTVYKGPYFHYTNMLDTKTYQKPQNLYQYLHFTSNHQKTTFKAIITGELIRYARTNTSEDNYHAMKDVLKQRLLARGYPEQLIDKTAATISHKDRQRHLQAATKPAPKVYPPILACLPPPQYHLLKQVILSNFEPLRDLLPSPRFVALRYTTLHNELERAKISPTDEQTIDIYATLTNSPANPTHHISALLPKLHPQTARTQRCKQPRCATCTHISCKSNFTSTKTKTTYPIRHSFTCQSTNVIYLITCKRCNKQYVGLTTSKLNVRINHHRTNIINKKPIYISQHFNFRDHSLNDLIVQPIDSAHGASQPYLELVKLEKYWIKTLGTMQPSGLNVSAGNRVT